MGKIAIVMGSESDREVVNEALPFLKYFNIEYTVAVMSAHRTPHQVQDFAEKAEEAGFQVIIACAGMAAHLPGVVAAYSSLPVIGVPLSAGALNGIDSLCSIVQMPAGVPVAAMAIGKTGMKNAAIFAAQIVARSERKVAALLKKFKQNQCRITE